jgi:hypothetical protein
VEKVSGTFSTREPRPQHGPLPAGRKRQASRTKRRLPDFKGFSPCASCLADIKEINPLAGLDTLRDGGGEARVSHARFAA